MTYDNLQLTYDEATNEDVITGAQWYLKAHREAARLAKAHNISVRHACGIIAALSPGMVWEENITSAWEICATQDSTLKPYGRLNIVKALRIYQGEDPEDVLRGPKVSAFYGALVDPQGNTPPCVDRHIISAWHGFKMTDKELKAVMHSKPTLRAIQADIELLAASEDIPVHACQAILWVVARAWSRDRTDGQLGFTVDNKLVGNTIGG